MDRIIPSRYTHGVIVLEDIGNGFITIPDPLRNHFMLHNLHGIVESKKLAGLFELDDFIGHDGKLYTLNEALEWTGEWLGVFYSEELDTWLIMADVFGFAQLHYAIIPFKSGKQKLVVSTTFRGILSTLKALDCALEIDWSAVLPHLTSTVNLFSTRASEQSFAKLIHVASHNNMLVCNKQGVALLPRPNMFLNSSTNMSYEDLLDKGIETAVDNINQLLTLNRNCSIALSGGKDSRVLFSLLLAAGKEKEFKVFTQRPSKNIGATAEILSQDLLLASKIVDKFGLEWYVPSNGESFKISFEESLNEWQDLRSNQSFEIQPRKDTRRNCNDVMLMGIGGELLRSYIGTGYKKGFPNWWANADANDIGIGKDLGQLFNHIVKPWHLQSAFFEDSKKLFIQSFNFSKSGNAITQIDHSYSHYRSRAHAGICQWRSLFGTLLFYPLARIEFVEANKLLSDEDQSDGKILFDIIERICPDLNALPYASPKWPDRFKTKGKTSFWQDASVERATELYSKSILNTPMVITKSNEIDDYDFHKYALERINENFSIVGDSCPDIDGIIDRSVRKSQKNTSHLQQVLAVTETLRDIVYPPIVTRKQLSIKIGQPFTEIIYFDEKIIKQHRLNLKEDKFKNKNLFLQHWDKIDLSNCTGVINRLETSIYVVLSNKPHECEVAYYFYADGVKLYASSYFNKDEWTLPNYPLNAKILRVTIFLRWKGAPEAQRVFDIGYNIK
ncbi:hypothetical protein [Avibacterium sp. 21-594]|uniref:hypothetical protein n=1 Tax=Avibacterium sp. 21-594 TaxID=2911535 RepID=UPI0022459348|nr:hypothetical protein [Avibacterium sp. 21-594]MCW9715291.1 hypothetical protein [Avibacterium sp. 21-594]